jgi:hypothetical protein
MEQKDSKEESVIFTSNEDILIEYGDLFEKEISQGIEFYLEKDFELDKYDPFRFIITPHGLIALSSSSSISGDEEDVWTLSTKNTLVSYFFQYLDSLVEMNTGNSNLRDLQGSIPYSEGYSYRILKYNHQRDSSIIKMILDERRMGFLMYKVRKDTLEE